MTSPAWLAYGLPTVFFSLSFFFIPELISAVTHPIADIFTDTRVMTLGCQRRSWISKILLTYFTKTAKNAFFTSARGDGDVASVAGLWFTGRLFFIPELISAVTYPIAEICFTDTRVMTLGCQRRSWISKILPTYFTGCKKPQKKHFSRVFHWVTSRFGSLRKNGLC